MRWQVKIEPKGVLPKHIEIVARSAILSKVLGRVRIDRPTSSFCPYVESFSPGKGMAKALVRKMDKVLYDVARRFGSSFESKVTFTHYLNEVKLAKYMAAAGYSGHRAHDLYGDASVRKLILVKRYGS